ncbi:MAG TPA: hypothetical protein VFV02_13800 [Acidimicrobiales bacterium]|nr:hypothetical protein [Acidimicrobiales bacterium]
MKRLEAGLLGLCLGIVAAGIVGVATHQAPRSRQFATTTTITPSTTVPSPTTTTAPAGPGQSSQTLASNLLVPADLGGFYHQSPPAGLSLFRSAPCLVGLGPSTSQSGSATQGLVGPDAGGLPFITEIVGSYPGSTAAAVYQQVMAALRSCPTFSANIGGGEQHIPFAEGNLQQVGDASSEFEGTFNTAGRAEKLQVGLALSSQNVICIVWVSVTSGYNPIYGDLPSTLSAAIGKLA